MLSAAACFAQDDTLAVTGTITFPKTGDIFISITTEKLFNKPAEGVRQYVIRLDGISANKKSVSFRFDSLAPAIYGIRCFQDVNRNGTLDAGIFGPTEPWSMSWRGKRPWGVPKFKQIYFDLQSDTSGIILNLK
jgi:uncharacterized protein (DUF2141 family)